MPASIRLLAAVALALSFAAPLHGQGWDGKFTSADRQALASHRLTMDNVSKAAAASAKIAELGEKDPKLKESMGREEAKSLTDAIEKMNGVPQLRGAIESSGLSSREFMLTVIELASTRAAIKLQAMGGQAAKAAAGMPTSPQNLQFYAAHQAELEPLADKIMRSSESSDN